MLEDGSAWTLGSGAHGQLGLGEGLAAASEPLRLALPSCGPVVTACCGWGHTLLVHRYAS